MSKVSTLCHTYEQDTLMESSLLARASFISTCQKATGLIDLAALPLPLMLVQAGLLPRYSHGSSPMELGAWLTSTTTTLDSGSKSEKGPTPMP